MSPKPVPVLDCGVMRATPKGIVVLDQQTGPSPASGIGASAGTPMKPLVAVGACRTIDPSERPAVVWLLSRGDDDPRSGERRPAAVGDFTTTSDSCAPRATPGGSS